ncbi:protein ccsmst1-like [Sinocyclocheilus rhinocerous]|uniref:protein ccsmst1-like n=1 Tax=Sinocyclocheilus rhinocerous TaxID=307959 RepID=UPI0007B98FD9|nr:PREDICTED: protein ccsmst1-like [Sinocyclocheilus rhinocerous]
MSQVRVHLSRFSLGHNVFTSRSHANLRPCVTRMLSLTSQLNAKPRKPPDDDNEAFKPIQFSTSKASHRTWKVDRSMGSTYQRPWWKVLPVSIIGVGFVVWCMFRRESEIDESLEKNLYEHLPGLLADEEQEEVGIKNKPS